MNFSSSRHPSAPRRPFAQRFAWGIAAALWATGHSALAQQPPPAHPDVTPPAVSTRVEAEYPPAAAAERRGGSVILTVVVDATGAVTDVQVAESAGADLDAAALAAVKQWKFTPASRAGQPIAAKIRVPITFVAPAKPPPAPGPAPAPTQLAPAPATPAPGAEGAPPPQAVAGPTEVTVAGRRPPPSRGAPEIDFEARELRVVPKPEGAAGILKQAAPSIMMTNEGGEGHAERIYLRGFDAREGQDIEMSVDGVPINESGNLHGNGFADLHFIIPELVKSLRVLEGPFDPRQGNYAVAGSADYELGLDKRGLTAQYSIGSYGTQRMLLLWGPPGETAHTFGGADIQTTDGFGQNRDARHARAMGQYEGRLGDKGTWRLAAAAYANEYHSAGLLREDDVKAGRKAFFDTYDFGQGGGGSRYHVSGDVETHTGDTVLHQQIFAIQRGMRLRENYIGFLLDTQEAIQQPHDQRGDLFDLEMDETTLGARGWARTRGKVLGQQQELELGYFARGDAVHATRDRIEAATPGVPYKKETDLESKLADVGIYADANLRLTRWLSLRGGPRADLFTFDVLDKCAVHDVSLPKATNPPGDASCLDQDRGGKHREPDQRSSTASVRLMPRATLIVGPFGHFSLSLSYGTGVRSIDPNYISQDIATPFAAITAYDGGVTYARSFDNGVEVSARSEFFGTHVDRDLIFSESEGRAILGGGTTRIGWIGAARVSGPFFDGSANIALVKSAFDDTGLLVPYVPDVVVRSDTALFHDVPYEIKGSLPRATVGAGLTYVGRRALPFGQRSDTIFTVDTAATISWKGYEVGLSVTNLFDRHYRLAEFNYVSDFHSAPAPTLVAARHFVAGTPRMFLVTFGATFGGT